MGCTASVDDVESAAHSSVARNTSSSSSRRAHALQQIRHGATERDRDPLNRGVSSRPWRDSVPPLSPAGATLRTSAASQHGGAVSAGSSVNASRVGGIITNTHTNEPPSVASTVQPSASHRGDALSGAPGGVDSQPPPPTTHTGSLTSPTDAHPVLDFGLAVGPPQLPTRPPSAQNTPGDSFCGHSSMLRSNRLSSSDDVTLPPTPVLAGGSPPRLGGGRPPLAVPATPDDPTTARRNPLEGPPRSPEGPPPAEEAAPVPANAVANPDGDVRARSCLLPGGAHSTADNKFAGTAALLPPAAHSGRGRQQRLHSASTGPGMSGSRLQTSASQFLTGSQLSSTGAGSVRE